MGCANSKLEKEESIRRCSERKRLMKQLISSRANLAACHLAYLKSLKNTGATLRQVAEVESVNIPENVIRNAQIALELPPPPPPLPHFSPLSVKSEILEVKNGIDKSVGNDNKEDDSDNNSDNSDNGSISPPPPPIVNGSAWEFWEPYEEEEDWVEANVEFDVEEAKNVASCDENLMMREKSMLSSKDMMDDDSSSVSMLTKDTDSAMVVWRTKKSLVGIVKEIDDYFLKAAAGGNDVVELLESDRSHRIRLMEEVKVSKSKSAKVFSSLSWNMSFKSLQSSKNAYPQNTSDENNPSNHSVTLEKIYSEELKLYKKVKEEELAKLLQKKKTLLLQKLEAQDYDYTKTELLRAEIDSLQSQIITFQESISTTCLLISQLRDDELHHQLIALTFGLTQMWRTMYECHQVQNHIAQQANLIERHMGFEPTTDAHRFATAQLETEVNYWYNSFCNLLKSQHDYVRILNQWVGLTDCLPDTNEISSTRDGIRGLCQEWQLALDRLPDKVASEAIRGFLSVIHSIVSQQKEEHKLQKKFLRLEKKLEKELASLAATDKHAENVIGNPLLATKVEALKRKVEEEKAKYQNSVKSSRAMTLNNLQTGLPNVFQALTGFAGVCVQNFEGICGSNVLQECISPSHSNH